ncbi:MAG: type II toxin-antitoxin system RelE/ParE family toxin [Deltaproteobacteria bacterium]|nr:type II toxin-antitoxin system RelE/ParE family toxin [Deltaproteobacteria bacterium]
MSGVTHPRVVEEYKQENGEIPFRKWLDALREDDPRSAQRIDARLARVAIGNLGNRHTVGEGVKELILDFGPGYRVYFAEDGQTLVILLIGGTKRGQSADIETAKTYWKKYKELKNENKKGRPKEK